MAVAAEQLLNDRLAEFRRLARSKGSLGQEDNAAVVQPPTDRTGKVKLLQAADATNASKKAASGFMRQFFADVADVQNAIKSANECVLKMDKVLEEILQATTSERQKAANDSIQQLTMEANTLIAKSKRLLEALSDKSEAEDNLKPAESRIRTNMRQAMARKQQQLLMDFQRSQMEFKRILEQRQEREMQLICPEASKEEVRQMIEHGQTSTQVVMRRMAGAHATILDEVERIRDKHQDILRLEQNIAELSQMFQEIAVLVDAQGDLLDNIEANVHTTDAYIVKGIKELEQTKKIMHNTRKWQCCLSVCCMLVLLAIFFPIMIRA